MEEGVEGPGVGLEDMGEQVGDVAGGSAVGAGVGTDTGDWDVASDDVVVEGGEGVGDVQGGVGLGVGSVGDRASLVGGDVGGSETIVGLAEWLKECWEVVARKEKEAGLMSDFEYYLGMQEAFLQVADKLGISTDGWGEPGGG